MRNEHIIFINKLNGSTLDEKIMSISAQYGMSRKMAINLFNEYQLFISTPKCKTCGD